MKGYSYREIANKMGYGVSPAGVMKLCKRYAESGSIKNKPGKGRHKATAPQTDRRIVRMALKTARQVPLTSTSHSLMLGYRSLTELCDGGWCLLACEPEFL